jgi:hypothetical protein
MIASCRPIGNRTHVITDARLRREPVLWRQVPWFRRRERRAGGSDDGSNITREMDRGAPRRECG